MIVMMIVFPVLYSSGFALSDDCVEVEFKSGSPPRGTCPADGRVRITGNRTGCSEKTKGESHNESYFGEHNEESRDR